MQNITILLLCILLSLHLSAQNWTFQTIDFGSKPSIAVDQEDRPHIAYMLESTSSGFVKYAVLQDTGFQITLVDQAYYYGSLAVALDSEGKPAIAVHHHDDEDEYIYRWTGNLWESLPVANEGHDGWDNSLTFDSEDNIHTSSINPVSFGSEKGVEYSFFDGNSWAKESIDAGPVTYEFSTCIQVDSKDIPHIVFYDDMNDDLIYANKTTGSWQHFVIASKGGMFASMVLDENDRPHIAYYEQTEGDTGMVKYIRYVQSEWKSDVIDQLSHAPIGFTGSRNLTALARDTTGKLHLSYGDRKVVKYATLEADGWAIEEVVNYTDSDTLLGAQTSLALDSKGNPHITYFELLDEFPVSGNIKYTTKKLLSSVQQISAKTLNFSVHPNPASNYIQIDFQQEALGNIEFQLLDLNGKVLRKERMKELVGQLNWSIAELPSGIYLVELKGKNQSISQKILKQ